MPARLNSLASVYGDEHEFDAVGRVTVALEVEVAVGFVTGYAQFTGGLVEPW
jgi:hypothetical protein